MEILGIDVGGSGIKGAIVNTETGEFLSERHRIPTPQPATPAAVADVVASLVAHFDWYGPVGCSFPTVVVDGQCLTYGNLSPVWVGTQVDQLFSQRCGGREFFVGNDADLAGIAEMHLGVGKGKEGTVVMITVGTGLGSGVFMDGKLVPNVELGFLKHDDGKRIELYAADSARKREELTLDVWAKRFNEFLEYSDRVLTPSLFIIGGGISKKFDKFKHHLTLKTPVVQAKFKNRSGIIGAAVFAHWNMVLV